MSGNRAKCFFAVAAAGLTILQGCASFYNVQVNAAAQPDAKDRIAYYVNDISGQGDRDSLRAKEVEKALKRALAGRGMYDVPNPEMASVVIDVDYTLGPPLSHIETYQDPIMRPRSRSYSVSEMVGEDENGKPIYKSVTVTEPDGFDITGYKTITDTVVEYEKTLRMSAREKDPNPNSGVQPISWEVTVSTDGTSKDLRKYLPVLAATAMDYVAENTDGPVMVKMKDAKDSRNGPAAFIMEGLKPEGARLTQSRSLE